MLLFLLLNLEEMEEIVLQYISMLWIFIDKFGNSLFVNFNLLIYSLSILLLENIGMMRNRNKLFNPRVKFNSTERNSLIRIASENTLN